MGFNCEHLYTYSVNFGAGKPLPVVPDSILFFGILFTVIGAISIIYPRIFWYLRVGRKLKGASPGKLYLWVLRFGGVLVVAIGLLLVYSTGRFGF